MSNIEPGAVVSAFCISFVFSFLTLSFNSAMTNTTFISTVVDELRFCIFFLIFAAIDR